jgi:RNase P/RNase MRP subunit p29
VRVGGFEGRIVDITPTAVVIATADGQAVVPAKEFSERASLLLTS